MKNSLFAAFCLLGTVLFSLNGLAEPPKIPLYVGEFLSKLGIKPVQPGDPKTINDSIARAVATAGYEAVVRTARGAKDRVTGCPYFAIRDTGEALVIEKEYTLIDDFRELAIYLHRDKGGHFDFASFTEGTRY